VKYHFERLILLLIVLGFLLCGCSDEDHATSGVNSHSAIVQELVSIVSTDNMLANQIDTALKEQEEGSFWAGKTLEDMYDFFDQWLVFTPIPDNTREYMDNFYEFANSEQGKAVVVNKSIREWLYEFMLARGEFMDSTSSTATLSSWLNDPK
jgi:phosphatidylserine decarboxylase